MNLDIRYYLAVFFRRLPIFLVVFLAIAAAGVWFAMILPPKFRAEAQLLVESPQISESLAASTVQAGGAEMLELLQQRLMTRANLLEIARKYDVLPRDHVLSPDEVVGLMRSQSRLNIEGGSRRDQTNVIFMTVSFTDEDAKVAASVTNEYVTRLLETSVALRQGRAGQTLDFFQKEVQRLDADLAIQSDKIVDFKARNADALPSDVPFRMTRLAQQEEQVAQLRRDKSVIEEQRKRLVEVFETTGQIAQNVPLTPEQQRLTDLQNQLNAALAIYSSENPRVKFLQAQVSQLEKTLSEPPTDGSGSAPVSQSEAVLKLQLAELDAREQALSEQIATTQAEIDQLKDQIARTRPNAIALESLERDYANIQAQYNASVASLATARTGERIELLSKGERITVLEQATVPNEPTSPDRPKIMLAGAAAGLGLGGGLVFLMELLNQAIRRPADIQTQLGITPLVTLPYVRTRRELFWKRLFWLAMITFAVVGVPAMLWAFNTYYMPYDLLFEMLKQHLPF